MQFNVIIEKIKRPFCAIFVSFFSVCRRFFFLNPFPAVVLPAIERTGRRFHWADV